MREAGTHVIDFEKTDILPNRLYFLKPDQIHFWDVVPPSKLAVVQFTPDFLTHLFGLEVFPALQTVYSSYFDLSAEKADTLLHLFTHMEHEFLSGERYSEKIIQAYLFVLLTEIERLNQSLEKTTDKEQQVRNPAPLQAGVERAFQGKQRPISEFSNLLNITPNYLNIVVKETTGKTANTLMHERVFLEAKRLLIQATCRHHTDSLRPWFQGRFVLFTILQKRFLAKVHPSFEPTCIKCTDIWIICPNRVLICCLILFHKNERRTYQTANKELLCLNKLSIEKKGPFGWF